MHARYESENYGARFPARAARLVGSHPYLYHWHDEMELILITNGSVDIGVRDQIYTAEAGDVLLIAPNVTHCLFASRPDSARLAVLIHPIILGRDMQQGVDVLSRLTCFSRSWPEPVQAALRDIVEVCYHELTEFPPCFSYAVQAQLFRLMTLAVREMPALASELADGTASTGSAQAILRYIASHYTSDMSLSSCADALGFSMNYLSRLFHRTFDISFSSYVMALRLRQAEWLLRNDPERPVTEIAYASGFQSIKTFNRVFKQAHGISPREYRAGKVSELPATPSDTLHHP